LVPTELLNGREVTTHRRCARDVAQRFETLELNHKRLLVQDGRFYTSIALTAVLNLSCDDSGRLWRLPGTSGWLFATLRRAQRAFIRSSHEAVNHVIRVPKISRHRPAWINAPDEDARARARNVELDNDAV